MVGISSLFSAYEDESVECANLAKRSAPSSVVVLGGGHPSALPRYTLSKSKADFVVMGEGEISFPSLVNKLQKGEDPRCLKGVAGRIKDNEIFVNEPCFEKDILSFLYPKRSLVDFDFYRYNNKPMTQILSSRGCPFSCAFCSAHLTSGRAYRARTPEDVVAEMEDCLNRFGIEVFDFEDDNLTFDTSRAKALMDLIVSKFGERRLILHAMNGVSMKGLSIDLLESMYRAGFSQLNLSPLSSAPATRSSMIRPENHEEALALPRIAAEMGFQVTAYIMMGYPSHSLSGIMESLATLALDPILLAPSPFYPAPGSKIHEDLSNGNKDSDEIRWPLMRSSLFPEIPGGLKRRESRTVFWLTRVANFAKSLTPDQDYGALSANLNKLFGGLDKKSDASEKGVVVQSSGALDNLMRGAAALTLYLENKRPYGIRILRRGRGCEKWEYLLFPLEQMIEDKSFYTKYGIPGFKGKP